jgi:hypothetical protein
MRAGRSSVQVAVFLLITSLGMSAWAQVEPPLPPPAEQVAHAGNVAFGIFRYDRAVAEGSETNGILTATDNNAANLDLDTYGDALVDVIIAEAFILDEGLGVARTLHHMAGDLGQESSIWAVIELMVETGCPCWAAFGAYADTVELYNGWHGFGRHVSKCDEVGFHAEIFYNEFSMLSEALISLHGNAGYSCTGLPPYGSVSAGDYVQVDMTAEEYDVCRVAVDRQPVFDCPY